MKKLGALKRRNRKRGSMIELKITNNKDLYKEVAR
jgi:hypothetical protein